MADRPILFSAPMVRALLEGIADPARRIYAAHLQRVAGRADDAGTKAEIERVIGGAA